MKRMHVGAAAAVFHRIETDFGLVVDELEIQAGACEIKTEPFVLGLDQAAEATAVISAASVKHVLEAKSPGSLRDFEVEIEGGIVTVACKATLVVQIPVKVTAKLEIVDATKVFVRVQHVDVLGGPAKNLVEGQIEKLNPIFDTTEFPFGLVLESVACEQGKVVLSGSVNWPGAEV